MIPDISISVFCQNEAGRIAACLASIARASEGLKAAVTIIVNGSSDGSAALALQASRDCRLTARIFTIAHGDKANAINHSFTTLRLRAEAEIFLDGYVIISQAALSGLRDALRTKPHAVAATGVAANGRTMASVTEETMRDGGRLHGQLHAFRTGFLDRLTAAGLRLPIGLYRGDGLLGSMACHDLDAVGQPWDGHRIAGVAEATYDIPRLSPFRPADIRRQFRRKVRQMRGRLETQAIKTIIYTGGYAGLPEYAGDMITQEIACAGVPRTGLGDRVFMALALRQLASARPDGEALRPVLVGEVEDGVLLQRRGVETD